VHQALQRVEIARLTQIEPRRQFAMAGVIFLIIARGDVRGGDLQDIGAVLGQGARAGEAGRHASEIERANAPIRERMGRISSNSLNRGGC